MADNLGPQFLYHGTAMDVEGSRLLPAKVHGKGSYWGDTGGDVRGEAANEHAWAHPSEARAWEFADDRLTAHLIGGHGIEEESTMRRSRVYALHPNEQQSPGHDGSIPGEVKAPHFDVAHQVDTKPGHQGTFPEINWNQHAVRGGTELPGDEDANHPSHLSVQFGHRVGVWGNESGVGRMQREAHEDSVMRDVTHAAAVAGPAKYSDYRQDDTLPGLQNAGKWRPR